MENNLRDIGFRACVVKIASLCNLNCTYCYIYNKGDLSYKKQPKFLAQETIVAFFDKMEKYFQNNFSGSHFEFVFHGGEPLLASKELYSFFIDQAKKVSEKTGISMGFGVQTNGVLVDEDWITFLTENNVKVGISLDSTIDSNNKNRIFHNGKSSYKEILTGFNNVKNHLGSAPGILSVLDISEDPEEVFNHYKSIGARYVNLLFPDDTYDDGFEDDLSMGKWLEKFYNLWLQDNEISLDQFESLLAIFYGADHVGSEYYGRQKGNTFILETNGEIQANDPLRVCLPNLHQTKLNVFDHQIEDLTNAEIAQFYYNSNSTQLCEKCIECPIADICSGGYFINRFSKKNGFDNPSIYCKSLGYFITKVQNSIVDHARNNSTGEVNIEKLDLEEMLAYCSGENTKSNEFLMSFREKQAG